MSSADPRAVGAKAAARSALAARRDGMTPDARVTGSAAICDAAIALLAARVGPGVVVASYAAKGSEVDPAAIDQWIGARGAVIVYPRVVRGERPLAFHAVPRAALEPAGFGLRAPAADSPAIALADIAVFLVPGLAFDRAGRRLGWGRGHYDATLARAPGALRVGLGFGCQVVDEVPHEAHDAALHVIITEDATLAVA